MFGRKTKSNHVNQMIAKGGDMDFFIKNKKNNATVDLLPDLSNCKPGP